MKIKTYKIEKREIEVDIEFPYYFEQILDYEDGRYTDYKFGIIDENGMVEITQKDDGYEFTILKFNKVLSSYAIYCIENYDKSTKEEYDEFRNGAIEYIQSKF